MVLLDHPDYTDREVADTAKCGLRTVGYAKANLIAEGHVKASYFDRTIKNRTVKMTERLLEDPTSKLSQSHTNSDTFPVSKTEFQDHDLTIEESLSMLAGFAKSAEREGNFPLAKDAVMAHRKLKDAFTTTELGPPPPQTDEEKVARTTIILDVVGPTLVATAICQAFNLIEDRAAFEEEFARQSVTHPPKDDTRASTLAGDFSNAETHEDQESPSVAIQHEASSAHSGSSDPFD